MPATFCEMEDVPSLMRANRSEEAVGPVLDRVVGGDALAELRPTAPRVERCAADARRGSPGRRASKRSSGRQQLVEDRVRGEHRQARRRRLVDDLVGRAGAHVVDQRVAAREERRQLGARHRRHRSSRGREPSSATSCSSSARCASLLVGERRPVHVQLDVVAGERHGRDGDVSSPFAGE